jgi:hypothetical protein
VKVTVPAGALSGPITVVTPEDDATSATTFTVDPGITGLSPGVGSAGDEVVVEGGGFVGVSSVKFDGVEAAGFVVESSSVIRAVVPATASKGRVKVTAEEGTATSPVDFLVVPAVSGFGPGEGAAGVSVLVSGRSFVGVSAVRFGGVKASFKVLSPTELTATVPGDAVSGPISVTSEGGAGESGDVFAVLPRVTGFSPGSGAPGVSVTVRGSGLAGATDVLFGGVAGSITQASATQVKVTVPAGALSGPITVVTPEDDATSATTFTVDPAGAPTALWTTAGLLVEAPAGRPSG